MARRQKQLHPIVTVGNKIAKAVRSDKAEIRTGTTRPQPVPMSDIRGLRQQVWKEQGLLDVRYKTPASLITARQKCRQATAHECRLIRTIRKKLFLVQTSARFPPIEPDSWVTRPTPDMHILKWAAQGYNKPEWDQLVGGLNSLRHAKRRDACVLSSQYSRSE